MNRISEIKKGEPMIRVKWEVPSEPKAGRGRTKGAKWAPVQLMLMENPGKWALIISSPKKRTIPPELGSSKYKRAYRTEDGLYKIYVMYVGQ